VIAARRVRIARKIVGQKNWTANVAMVYANHSVERHQTLACRIVDEQDELEVGFENPIDPLFTSLYNQYTKEYFNLRGRVSEFPKKQAIPDRR
jgi:hypothetical protein